MKLGGGCLQHACLFSWISTPLASVSHNEMSIVILSILQQPSPALWLRLAPTETLMEQHSSPSWSSWPHIAVAHLSDPLTVSTQADVLTSPTPALASYAKALCNIFILPLGRSMAAMLRSKTGQLQVAAWHLHLWEKMQSCPWARHISCKAKRTAGRTDERMGRWWDSGWKCLKFAVLYRSISTTITLENAPI